MTTVPQRRTDLCPATLASLAAGGFGGAHRPWLFVDGCDDLQGWRRDYGADDPKGRVRGVTCRYPLVRAFASWVLAVTETFYRDPCADRYAVFQDDVEAVANLREYLETVPLEPKTYWNLYLGPWNENPREFGRGRQEPLPPWLQNGKGKGKAFVGLGRGDQRGRGAMALVFDRETVIELATSKYLINRPADVRSDGKCELNPRGYRLIDGGVVEALRALGYAELVHHPSLVRHVGVRSTVDRRGTVPHHDPNFPRHAWPKRHEGLTFPGQGFDALSLVGR